MDIQYFTPDDMAKASKFCKHEYKTLALHSATQIDYQGYCIVTLPDTLGGSFVMETSDSGNTWYYFCESEVEYISQHMTIPEFTHYEIMYGYSDQQSSYEMKFPKVQYHQNLVTAVYESDFDTPQDMIAFLRNRALESGLNCGIGYLTSNIFCLYMP
jgi:hypothetical protein